VVTFPWVTVVRLPMKNLEKPWYEATRVFGPYNGHPRYCEDWNLEAGGDSDLGEPLVAPWSGVVINAYEAGGAWGKIVRIMGLTPAGDMVTWMGAHLAEVWVRAGDVVMVGDWCWDDRKRRRAVCGASARADLRGRGPRAGGVRHGSAV